jgi:type VI secretion system protein ImpL
LQHSGQSAGAVARLEAGGANMPNPVKEWVVGVGQTSSNISLDNAKDQLASLWSGGAGRLCAEATKGRYPFSKGSAQDVPLGDFGRLFATGGAIDSFFTHNLASYVDMSQDKWRMRQAGPTAIKLEPGALAQFQRAASIRDGMFANGGNTPTISFQLSVIDLDKSASGVVIDVDGQHLTFSQGAPVSMRMQWPAPDATGSASVTFNPSTGGDPVKVEASGPWALFRLLDMGAVHQAGGPDQLQARFAVGDEAVVVELRADSVLSPLNGSLLSQFRCPSGL